MISTAYAYACLFFNVRINYKRFKNFLSPTANTLIFALGISTAISLPILGVFDQYEYFKYHAGFAIWIFFSGALY